MDTCDIIVVGGGPAGSSCAWRLGQAGLDVVVIDGARFPRDKVCAGWITPQVIDALQLNVADYGVGRTFQPITGFRTGLIGGRGETVTAYGHPVSFGIRRCEFDHYLLDRSGARQRLGTPVTTIARDPGGWVVNSAVRAPMLVGAGGHFCPVARFLNRGTLQHAAPVVVAQEIEFALGPSTRCSAAPEQPALYFCRDLKGYGWCFRKERHVNVGFGRLSSPSLPRTRTAFLQFLETRIHLPLDAHSRFAGHAYLLAEPPHRRVCDDGLLLIGDAAGLAYPQSGEGIRPAVESGLLAARTIIEAERQYAQSRLEAYEHQLGRRLGFSGRSRWTCSPRIAEGTAPLLLNRPWFVRHMLLDHWFLHAGQPALHHTVGGGEPDRGRA